MNFYDALQLDPAVLKGKIKAAQTRREKLWLFCALSVRSALILAFAVCFISALTALFGSKNSNMAVLIFCILLCARFVDFGYRIFDSLVSLAAVFLILLFSPLLVQLVPGGIGLIVNLVSTLAILVITSQRPEMGNAGLYLFGYFFLSGTMITPPVFFQRCLMALTGYLICAAVFYQKHRKKHADTAFRSILADFSLRSDTCRWQLQTAVGVSLAYFIGSCLEIERLMWMCFACSSILTAYKADVRRKAADRAVGAIIGSCLFAIIYPLVPASLHTFIAPAAGLSLGFCGQYRSKTVFNCFGALMTAASLYGLKASALLRVFDNLLGALFAVLFFYLCAKLLPQRIPAAAPGEE